MFEPIHSTVKLRATLIEAFRLLIQLNATLFDLGFGSLHDLDRVLARLAFDQPGLLAGPLQNVLGFILLVLQGDLRLVTAEKVTDRESCREQQEGN